jgi:hypothetical protein
MALKSSTLWTYYQHLQAIVWQAWPLSREFGAVLLGVNCCSHTLLLHAGASARRARSHPEEPRERELSQRVPISM